jgi:hypothetical protein
MSTNCVEDYIHDDRDPLRSRRATVEEERDELRATISALDAENKRLLSIEAGRLFPETEKTP